MSTLNISLLVGLKNNLEYSKKFYETTRNLYPNAEIVFTSYGSTDGTNEWLDSLDDKNLRYYYSLNSKSLADTYNKCIEIATKDYVVLLHNDMILTPNFLENILKHLNNDTIVGYSFIEPPIYASDIRVGKTISDFGTNINDLKLQELYDFSDKIQNTFHDKIEAKIELRFFISAKNNILKSINGLDNLFSPMFFEDDDLFLRLEQLNLKMITALDAICYHFVSKTSRFSEEISKKTKQIEKNSMRNFQRKWGFPSYNDKRNTYDTGIVIKNATLAIISEIEPFCNKLYTDCDFSEYIKNEQSKTKFDLTKRIFPIQQLEKHELLLEVDGSKFDKKTLEYIKNVYKIINKKEKKILFNIFSKIKTHNRGLHIKFQKI